MEAQESKVSCTTCKYSIIVTGETCVYLYKYFKRAKYKKGNKTCIGLSAWEGINVQN